VIHRNPEGDPLRNDKRSWRRRPWIEPPASRLRFLLRNGNNRHHVWSVYVGG